MDRKPNPCPLLLGERLPKHGWPHLNDDEHNIKRNRKINPWLLIADWHKSKKGNNNVWPLNK